MNLHDQASPDVATSKLIAISVAAGVLLALLLQLWLVLSWRQVYAGAPRRGYELAVRSGRIPPYFTSSPRAVLHSEIVFCAAAFAIGVVTRTRKLQAFLAFGTGVAATMLVVSLYYPYLRQSNFAPLAIIVVPLYLAPALAVGATAAHIVERFSLKA